MNPDLAAAVVYLTSILLKSISPKSVCIVNI